MPKFRTKSVVKEAVQFTGMNQRKIVEYFGFGLHDKHPFEWLGWDNLYIITLEGRMKAVKNDWIIRGVSGEFYPCKPDIFAATYDLVEETEAMTDSNETKPAEALLDDTEFSQRMTTANRVILDASRVPAHPEKCPNCSHPVHLGVCPMPCLCGIRRESFFGDETAQPDLSELDLDHDGPDDVEEDSAAQPITAEEAARPITIDDALEVIRKTYWDNADELWNRGAKESFRAIIQRATDSALTEAMRQNAELTAMFAKDSQEAEAEIKRLREQLAQRDGWLDEFYEIFDNSNGVIGWHLNGDTASWNEFPCIDEIRGKLAEAEKAVKND